MPKPRPIATKLGNGKGAFNKALKSCLLQRSGQEDALERAEDELGKACVYCGTQSASLQADLLWPEAIGGLHVAGNVVPACPTCNSERGSKDWEKYLSDPSRMGAGRSQEHVEKTTRRIRAYMRKHGMDVEPKLEEALEQNDLTLLAEIDLVFDAVKEGFRQKIGDAQTKSVKFAEPARLLDEMIALVKRHRV